MVGPVSGQERIEAIDILRGVAILGILILNMGLFSMPEDAPVRELAPNAVDRAVETLILFFAQEKFKTLFSFLFGLGLAVQMMRAEARGARFLPLYVRRLCVLFLIGEKEAPESVQTPGVAEERAGGRPEVALAVTT